MKINWKLIKTTLGIGVLTFLVSFSAQRHACKPMKDVEVKVDTEYGSRFINDSIILKIINGKELKLNSIPLGNMDISKVEKHLDKDPFIRKSQVFKDVDGVVKVQINQKTPVARIKASNEEYYLSEDLTKIPLSPLYASEVILVGGDIIKDDYKGLRDLADVISADKLLKKHIIAIKKEAPNSFILLVNKGSYIIEFGELEEFQEKFDKLNLFYEQYLGKVGLDYYEKINLRYKNQIVATKRINDEK
ncbi:MAG: cell division protein FtsQ [Weeksellaceae bacterium]